MRSVVSAAALCTPYVVVARQFCVVYFTWLVHIYSPYQDNVLFYSVSEYPTREIKCQLDATEVFIADLIACSTCFGHHYAHHQELKSIIQWFAACGISCCGFQVAGLVWS